MSRHLFNIRPSLLLILLATPGLTPAAITYVGSGTFAASNNANVTPTLASGHTANDIDLVLAGFESPSGTLSVSGYTQLFLQSTTASKLFLFCKVDTGTESNPIVVASGGVTGNSVIAKAYSLRGALADCSNIVAHSASQNNGNVDLTMEYPALAITTPSTFVGIAYLHGEDNTAGDSTPAGFTDTGYVQTGLAGDQSLNLKYQIQSTATNIPGGRITISGTQNSFSKSIVISLKPSLIPPANRTVCASGCTDTTIASMVAALSAGQIGEIRANALGGTRTFTGTICLDLTGKTATSGNDITIRARSGDHIIFDCSLYGIRMSNTSYAIVDGQNALTIGIAAQWSHSDGGTGYNQNKGFAIDQSNYVQVLNSTIYGGGDYLCNEIGRTTNHFRIAGNSFFDCGDNASPNNNESSGDQLFNGGIRGIVENNNFTRGGHDLVDASGAYQVYRNNNWSQDWTPKNTGFPGYRIAEFAPGDSQKWHDLIGVAGSSTLTSTFGPMLVEGNFFTKAGEGISVKHRNAHKVIGFDVIVRGNYYFQNDGTIWSLPGYTDILTSSSGQITSRPHLYHNTSYDSKGVARGDDSAFNSAWGVANQQEWRFKNNLFQAVHDGYTNQGSINAVKWDADLAAGSANLNGYPNAWKGTLWQSNIFGGDSSAMRFQLTGAGAATVDVTNGMDTNLDGDCADAGDSGQWPANICSNENSPLSFVNATAGTRAGLALSPSNTIGLGDALYLTTVTATSDSRHLTLADAYYFYDGANSSTWDLSYFGESGDCIAVTPTAAGTASTAVPIQIESINYNSGQIVVAAPGVQRAVGSKVWMATKNSNGICGAAWDNRGAGQ